jgi:hypothetical protein
VLIVTESIFWLLLGLMADGAAAGVDDALARVADWVRRG